MKIDISRLLELQRLLGEFSRVERRAHRRHGDKYVAENDTEHSYNLAMTAWYVSQFFPDLDRDLLIRYALVHDLIEVHAGDTYIYGAEDRLASKEQREAEAVERLKADWGDFGDMIASIEGYEHREDKESRFIYALDKVMPIMLIYVNEGYSWQKEGVTVDMIYRAKREKVGLSPEIWPYFEQLHKLLLSRPELIRPV